jgi:glycosyltransferase involved in cell wall biosynthesis
LRIYDSAIEDGVDPPSISVIVPNCDDAEYLAESLPALCEQSIQPKEIIVVDDGSSDNSIETVKAVAAKFPIVRLLTNETALGFSMSINRGIQVATGDYLYVACADDLVCPGFFERCLYLLEKNPKADRCFTDRVDIDAQGDVLKISRWLPAKSGYLSGPEVLRQARQSSTLFPGGPQIVFRRSAINSSIIYDPALVWYDDLFLHIPEILRRGCCYLPEPLVAVRCRRNGSLPAPNRKDRLFREVCVRLIKVCASRNNKDIFEAIVYSRFLRFIELEARIPLLVLDVLICTNAWSWRTFVLLLQLSKHYLASKVIAKLSPGAKPFRIPVPYTDKRCSR